MIIHEFLFADACALAASCQDDLQELTDHFSTAANKFGLTICLKKTEPLCQAAYSNSYSQPKILIDGKPIKIEDNFKYLGSIVSRNGSLDPEL